MTFTMTCNVGHSICILFLNNRFSQVQEFRTKGQNVIQDRTDIRRRIYFALTCYAMGLMTSRDFESYFYSK